MIQKRRIVLIFLIVILLISIVTVIYNNKPVNKYSIIAENNEGSNAISLTLNSIAQEDTDNTSDDQQGYESDIVAKANQEIESTVNDSDDDLTPTIINGILIVNKTYGIPEGWANGADPTALAQVNKLIADAQAQGLNISNNVSGFRSYQKQTELFNNYCEQDGIEAAMRYSARPGHSEHETGLAFDLIDNQGNLVESAEEAEWIAKNCAKYGFIVRYPQGKEAITGYMYEPWHLRYVGVDAATQIMNSNLTLEEYLGV